MRDYNPISLQVIRNALLLSGVPLPMHIHRIDKVKFPSATIVTAYRCLFAGDRVLAYMGLPSFVDPQSVFAMFTKDINECFCEDIFASDWDFDVYNDVLQVTICTRFVTHPAEVSRYE